MRTRVPISSVALCLAALFSPAYLQAQPATASLSGTITDPSGAAVPGAQVQLRGPGGELRRTTDSVGQYNFSSLQNGRYSVRLTAKGFAVVLRENLEVRGTSIFDYKLTIAAQSQVLNVEGQENSATAVSTDPASNGGAIVLGQKQLEALSDDPDELSQQLQAMAGPGAGPEGGQIFIDGFSGGNLPPKSSIREIRINSNPFSAEYDRQGFGRIEIFTKPGMDSFHGQIFVQYNNQYLNTRSPLYTQSSSLPPYKNLFYGGSFTGPIKKNKASFTLDFERRNITENAFILATNLDASLHPQTLNAALLTPQTRTSFTPRVDYAINGRNTLVLRYQEVRIGLDNQGAGSFNLSSTAYNQSESEHTFQGTETAVLGPNLINESRFQFMRTSTGNTVIGNSPSTVVSDAFTGGSATVGNSRNLNNRWEFNNVSTLTHKTHTLKWGGRFRQSFNDDTSLTNFNGTFTFLGAQGQQLGSDNRPISGTSVNLTALQVYQLTLAMQQDGYTAAQIRAAGGGASFFSLNAGTALTRVTQFDIGLFLNDDWRIRPNLTLSYGLRYETQTNISDRRNWAPRVGVAWGVDGHGSTPAKTILRAGFGIFYDRLSDTTTLNALRYNGVTQQSYLISNPDFFPNIPSTASLSGYQQQQTLRLVSKDFVAPRNYQANISVDRQVAKSIRLSVSYVNGRGVHLARTVNANAPYPGTSLYPYGDSTVRLQTESVGFSRTNQFSISPTVNYKKLFLFGFYTLSYGKDDNEGLPENHYNLRAEWGPSSFADVRHRAVLGTGLPLPWKITVTPFFNVSSGSPYNITTGLPDPSGDGSAVQRPALVNLAQTICSGNSLKYVAGYGCFDLNPAAGTMTLGRNSGRGPGAVNLSLRLSRTWGFGSIGESGPTDKDAPPPGMGGARGGGPPGGPGGAGPPPGGGPPGGGPPPGAGGIFGGSTPKRYNVTLSMQAMNILNHPNFAAPNGNLSSPFFGQSLSLQGGFGPDAGGSTYLRKVSLQLRLTF